MRFAFFCLLVLVCSPGSSLGESYAGSTSHQHFIDFRMTYVIPETSTQQIRLRRATGIGFDLAYQFYFSEYLGLDFSPGAWFMRVKNQSGTDAALYSFLVTTGLALRPFPDTYFDPSFLLNGGASFTDAGDLGKGRFSFPFFSRAVVSLYRYTSRYKDLSLSFAVSGTYYHYVRQISLLEARVMDIGLALKGSF